jgi:hypothetical protein
MPPLTLATPVDDQDTKSSKDERKLRQCHLWKGQENIGVVIVVNSIFPEILFTFDCVSQTTAKPSLVNLTLVRRRDDKKKCRSRISCTV